MSTRRSSGSSAYSAPRSSTDSSSSTRSSSSMDSSVASRYTADAQYRSGFSDSLYTTVKKVSSSRGGSSVTVIHHNRPNPDEDEPRSSDWQHSEIYHSKK
ncbi:hypothetical protein C8A00DRAFT_33925 [Chaetomidium leptoderma]|uniref:Uncharacterized protein n=1 Tax=Chaetomidium leptoderma TaxID=669021 RepID=A0AAN6VLE4_9PEZI|nr:hypothetical protein C8A00DRAFT_33925 [Chaetomidium leptoderma]